MASTLHRLRDALVAASLLLAVAGAGAATPTSAPATPGPAVAIGGALRYDHAAVWSRLVELAGGRGARFVVLATASADPALAAARSVAALQAQGAIAEALPVAPKLPGVDLAGAVRDPALVDKLRRAQGVFFTGGAQELIVDTLAPGGRPTPLLEAIRELQARGGVVAGTSAGAAVMSATMFRDAVDVLAVMKGRLRPGRELDAGLGFAGEGLFVDQHFLRRGRLGRMLAVMVERGLPLGVGVEEDSAAIIHRGTIEVVGAGGVLVVDLRESASDPALGAFNLRNARLSFLGDGDRLELATRRLTPSAAKAAGQRIDPRAPGFRPYFESAPFLTDLLAEGAVLRGMTLALDGPGEVLGLAFDPRPDALPPADLGFEFRFSRGPDSAGWFSAGAGGEDYTLENLRLDVTPVRIARPLYAPWRR